MFPALPIARSPLDDVVFDGGGLARWHLAVRALPSDAAGASVSGDGPAPAVEEPPTRTDRDRAGTDEREPRRTRRRRRLKAVAVAATLVLAVGTSFVLGQRAVSEADRADRYKAQLDAARTRVDGLEAESSAQLSRISLLEARLNEMRAHVTEIKSSKIRTVVKTKVKKVPRWVPDGKAIDVDTTGFEGRIAIHDVQITHAYGYSHLIGIAINKSDETVSYAQLGCTFVDADGGLLANEIVNKATWAPGQSWGFDCSAQVDATGGLLRVDDMT